MNVADYRVSPIEPPEPPLVRFERFLRARGRRMTSQRRIIVTEVFSHHDHFDAEDLMEHLRERMNSREVSRPTVYRTLSELVEAGLLKRMVIRDRYVYEHEYGYPEHDHLYCQGCHQLFEFRSEALRHIRESVAREYDFEAVTHRMMIIGWCSQCRAKRDAGQMAEADNPTRAQM